MLLCLNLSIKGSLKSRSIEKSEAIHAQVFEQKKTTPSHVSIRNWIQKVGYYELTRKKEKGIWLIILDHSIQFGDEKILVVLGIQESDFLALNRPLKYEDLTPLLIKPATKWNGELVKQEIVKLKKELGSIKYATADYGSDLKKGLRLSKVVHIHDLSHLISLIVEKLYSNDERYETFKTQMGKMRAKFIQTNIAATVPPGGRTKSEYQNFERIVNWGNGVFNLLDNKLTAPKEIKKLQKTFGENALQRAEKELQWVREYKELLIELTEINQAIKNIEKAIKHNGLTSETHHKSLEELQKLTTENGKLFKQKLQEQLQEQRSKLPQTEKIQFSSDILESIFGKYKNRVSDNQMASVTGLMLVIAAFTTKLTTEKVQEIMENVKISDIKAWEKKTINNSLFKKRNALYSNK
jgi:hypothetical protein